MTFRMFLVLYDHMIRLVQISYKSEAHQWYHVWPLGWTLGNLLGIPNHHSVVLSLVDPPSIHKHVPVSLIWTRHWMHIMWFDICEFTKYHMQVHISIYIIIDDYDIIAALYSQEYIHVYMYITNTWYNLTSLDCMFSAVRIRHTYKPLRALLNGAVVLWFGIRAHMIYEQNTKLPEYIHNHGVTSAHNESTTCDRHQCWGWIT